MLVLTRRTEESVVIGEKLGIDAPRDVTILRSELLDVIRQQNRLAEKLASLPEPPALKGLRDLLSEERENPQPTPPAG